MNANQKRWIVIVASSLVIHIVFCLQAIYATHAGAGGLVANDFFLIAFLPHYMIMYFSPPNWPIINGVDVDGWRVAGKLVVSYPASLLYGWLVGALWHLAIAGLRRIGRTRATRGYPPQSGR